MSSTSNAAIRERQEEPVEQDGDQDAQHFGLESTMEQVEPDDGDINNHVEEHLVSEEASGMQHTTSN